MKPSDKTKCPNGGVTSTIHSTRVVRHPRFRYSVGAMLALVTIICIWLSSLTNSARQQKQAVAAILALGGQVRYDYEPGIFEMMTNPGAKTKEPPGPRWLRELIGDDYFQAVTEVHLRGRKVTDSDLRWISSLPNITTLLVMRTSISDASLSRIGELSQLKNLILRDNKITDQGLSQLYRLCHLEQLNVINTLVTSEGVTRLKNEVGQIRIHVEEPKPVTLKYQALPKLGTQTP